MTRGTPLARCPNMFTPLFAVSLGYQNGGNGCANCRNGDGGSPVRLPTAALFQLEVKPSHERHAHWNLEQHGLRAAGANGQQRRLCSQSRRGTALTRITRGVKTARGHLTDSRGRLCPSVRITFGTIVGTCRALIRTSLKNRSLLARHRVLYTTNVDHKGCTL